MIWCNAMGLTSGRVFGPCKARKHDSGVTGEQSGCDVVLVSKPAEDLLTVDLVVGELGYCS